MKEKTERFNAPCLCFVDIQALSSYQGKVKAQLRCVKPLTRLMAQSKALLLWVRFCGALLHVTPKALPLESARE